MLYTKLHPFRLVALIGACLLACVALAQSLEIIDLEHRSAADMIPILQPLLEPGGALTGQDYKLFVRASPANIAQLRKALAQLDRAPRQFLVSVRRATQQQVEQEHAGAGVAIGSDGGSVSLSTNGSAAQRESNAVQSVRVLEGSSAFIASGTSVPVITSAIIGGGRRPRVAVATSYRDLNSGFTVTPRLAGERVTLDVSQQSERRADDGSGVQTESLSTQVTGRLGEWLRLGGVHEATQSQSSGILSGSHATRSDEQSLWIKVVVE